MSASDHAALRSEKGAGTAVPPGTSLSSISVLDDDPKVMDGGSVLTRGRRGRVPWQHRIRVLGAKLGVNLPLWVAVAVVLVPYLYAIGAEFQNEGELVSYPPHIVPPHPTLSEFSALFSQTDFGRWFENTLIIAVAVTVLASLLASLAAYALAFYEFVGKRVVMGLVLVLLAVPYVVFLVPLYIEVIKLHLINTDLGVILPEGFSAFGVFLLRQYMLTVPKQLLDAARVDGASEFRIYRSIVVPTVIPAVAIFALFTFNAVWNDYVWPTFVFSSEARFTLPLGLASFLDTDRPLVGLALAGSVLAMVPSGAVFLWLQRYLRQVI